MGIMWTDQTKFLRNLMLMLADTEKYAKSSPSRNGRRLSNWRAAVACSTASFSRCGNSLARGCLWLQADAFGCTVHPRRCVFLWISAVLLGSAHAILKRSAAGLRLV